jgi:hypothetical protein
MRTIRWGGGKEGEKGDAYRVSVGKPDLGVDWRIILKLIFNKWDARACTD